MVKIWLNTVAIAAETAYPVPAAAGLPPGARIVGVRSVVIAPLATGGAASAVSPVSEVGVANSVANPAAGDVSCNPLTQELVSGDAIAANALVIADLVLHGEQSLNP